MDYEIVNLESKLVVGLSDNTGNSDPEMGNKIYRLWESFYKDGIYEKIGNKVNEKSYGIYSDYTGKEKSDYAVTVACEVENADSIPEKAIKKVIPAGKYAKFVVRGHYIDAVAEFWEKFMKMDIPHSFVCDFEEYKDCDENNSEINIYIGLK